MPRSPIDLPTLLTIINAPQSVEHLKAYFEPDRPAGQPPRYSGSRFEFLAGGGDRPEVADVITADDLVAVTTLSVHVPGDVALSLLEDGLGPDITRHLEEIPVDVSISDAAAAELLGTASHAWAAWDLLEEPHGMGWVITNKLLARKRPHLIPVYDGVVRCAYGYPDALWNWLPGLFGTDAGRLDDRLLAIRDEAAVSTAVSALRVLDVVIWMRHRPDHRQNGCPRVGW